MKMRQLSLVSSSQKLLDHLNQDRGLSDPEIARIIGVRPTFIAMVRLGELPLAIDHLVLMAEAFGMRLGAFLLSTNKGEPKTENGKRWAEFCKKVMLQGDALDEAIERSQRGKQSA